ncbi:MAG: hypothetical protein JO065_01415 [Acidobacteria bacterium]|nr:hypothetical protein [Acidobacteriota bacterium]
MKRLIRFFMAVLLASAMSVPVLAQQNPPTSNFLPKTQDQDRDRNRDRGGREHHPHIRSAIRELQEAKRELQSASHDFGGHREDALKACDEAIRQLQQALQYDKK